MTTAFSLQSVLHRPASIHPGCYSLHSNSILANHLLRHHWHIRQSLRISSRAPCSQFTSLVLAAAVVCVASPSPPPSRRALGVDYGRKQIGLAVSTLGLAPRPMANMRGGGIDMLMQMAQGIIDAAQAEGKFH